MLRRRTDAPATRRGSMATTSAPVSTLYPARQGTRPVAAEDLWTVPRVGAPAPLAAGRLRNSLRHVARQGSPHARAHRDGGEAPRGRSGEGARDRGSPLSLLGHVAHDGRGAAPVPLRLRVGVGARPDARVDDVV